MDKIDPLRGLACERLQDQTEVFLQETLQLVRLRGSCRPWWG